jgi:hypothetical protein
MKQMLGYSIRSTTVPILVSLVGALGYVNWQLMSHTVDLNSTATHRPASTQSATSTPRAPAAAVRSAAEFPETTARPVFFADRRTPEKPKPKPQAQVQAPPPPIVAAPIVAAKEIVPPPDPLILVGIMGSRKAERVLLRTKTDPEGTWLSVGDEYHGWQLREVLKDMVVVEARGQRSQLKLYSSVSGKTQPR